MDFEAADEVEAIITASIIYDACSDIAFGYEVWNREKIILASQAPVISQGNLDLAEHQQQIIVDTEVALHDSAWAVAQSKKLIEQMNVLAAHWGVRPNPARFR